MKIIQIYLVYHSICFLIMIGYIVWSITKRTKECEFVFMWANDYGKALTTAFTILWCLFSAPLLPAMLIFDPPKDSDEL